MVISNSTTKQCPGLNRGAVQADRNLKFFVLLYFDVWASERLKDKVHCFRLTPFLIAQNTITISFVSSITLQPGYVLSVTGLQGANSVSRTPDVVLKDSSGGCQHQNLFAASLNSSIRGTAHWEASSGTLQTVIISTILRVQKYALLLATKHLTNEFLIAANHVCLFVRDN
jgi:hypothetical protein